MGIAMDAPRDRAGTLSRFQAGLAALEAVVSELSDDALDAVPSGGGWSVRQIVHHLADGDDIWKLAIKMAIGNDGAEFALGWYRTLTQREWADRWAYNSRPIGASLSLLKANRDNVLQILEHTPDAWNRAVSLRKSDGEVERVPVGFIVEMQAEHVFHHLRRIEEILKGRCGT
jgi:uncharacterized damage-inducible protein DinB